MQISFHRRKGFEPSTSNPQKDPIRINPFSNHFHSLTSQQMNVYTPVNFTMPRRSRACALFAGIFPSCVWKRKIEEESVSQRKSSCQLIHVELLLRSRALLWRTARMNCEAIVRGVRMLKIVKVGSNGLRRLHTSNKRRAAVPASKKLGRAKYLDAAFGSALELERAQTREYSFIHDSHYMYTRDHDQATNAEDVLFDMFKNEDTGLLAVGKFLAALRTTGLRNEDPRLQEFTDNLRKEHLKCGGHEGVSHETQKLNREQFRRIINPNIVLISRAFRHQFIIPDWSGFTKHIEDFYWKCKSNSEGKVASYIPQLARMNPDYWGVSVCTIDGQRFSIGDTSIPFTLQSCSKPLTYAIALDRLGQEVVHQYVGQEPSGRNFNELVLDYNKKPHNPMINAGAILVCSLLKSLIKPEMTLAEKFDFTINYFKRLAGEENLGFNNAVFLSEREAADRNYALGFYMREHNCYPDKSNLKEILDFYFQCCSMEANCDTMAVMAATLANGGICPITEEKVLKPDSVRDVLSLMHSCGMYDYSGQFAFKVGIPAKSGVSGCLLVVIPNVMGICTWSPPLDPLGNSCRGVQFCQELVSEFNFHSTYYDHRYDNLKHATNKKDPRRHKYETKGLSIVNLLFSAASGDVTAMRRHRLSGMDMTLSDYDGRTALHLAASEGHLDCVEFLIEQCGVPHNPKDRWGKRPIDEAETFGHMQVVEYLNNYAIALKTEQKNEEKENNTEEGDERKVAESTAQTPIP